MRIERRVLTCMDKVFLDEAPGETRRCFQGFQNEKIDFQLAYRAEGDAFSEVRLEIVSPLEDYLSVREVRQVPVERPISEDAREDCLRTAPGLYPDLLRGIRPHSLHATSQWRSLWLRVEADEDVAPGVYPVDVTLWDAEGEAHPFPTVQVEILPGSLPRQKLIHTKWFHTDCLCQYYHVEPFSKEYWEIVTKYFCAASLGGINMILMPVHTPPLDTRPGGERMTIQLAEITVEKGEYRFDLSKVQLWIDLCKACGVEYYEIAHLFTQWGAEHAPKIMATVDGKYKQVFGWDTDAAGEEYGRFLRAYIPALRACFRKEGIEDRVYWHISDEPSEKHLESYAAARRQVEDVLQGCHIMDALSDFSFYQRGLVTTPVVANNRIEPFLEAGVKGLWTYYCCGQTKKVSNMFIAFPSYRNRVLGVQLFKFAIEGFLQWGFNFYNTHLSDAPVNPYATTDAEGWVPAGDPCQVCPGEGGAPEESIRMAVTCQAMQDLRALEWLSGLAGRDFALSLIDEGLGTPLTFSEYPRSSEYLLHLRDRVNAEIVKRMTKKEKKEKMEGKSFAYRGFMLDAARHFMPVEDVCRIIEAAALSGMNRMHWHLTDDQGWRLEIKKYPRLTEIGSVRGDSYFGEVSETENNCGFYTQEEVRQVVAFARERGVEIVPEIEVPGHASAMLAAYPEFGCRRMVSGPRGEEIIGAPYDYRVITYAGIFPNLICAGRDEAVNFLRDILEEVTELFPGPEVHIGGDEAVKLHWRRCPDCQRRMKEKGLKDEHELQRWLVLQMGAFLAEKGKKTIVWNESLDGGLLPDHFIVQHWLGNDKETAEFMAAGGKVIRSEASDYYISRTYSAIDAYHIWETPSIPPYAREHPENLMGVECPMWSERVTNPKRAAYLLFPRLPAVALRALFPDGYPTWEEFLEDLKAAQARIEPLGLTGAPESVWRMAQEDAEKEKADQERVRHSSRMERVFAVNDGMLWEDALEKLLRDIDMPWPFALQVMDCAWAARAEHKDFFGTVQADPGLGAGEMASQLKTAVENRHHGAWKGLPEDVFLDTMKCFTRFVREHERSCGKYGFDRSFWTTRQISARLFRIGELEYELLEKQDGGRAISLHIPSDAKLEGWLLDDSVARARAFLRAYFPDWADLSMECESWLLSPQLKELLPEKSRILMFQRAFDLTPGEEDARGSVLEWVYHLTHDQQKEARLSELPEDTTLQRRMKEYLLNGGKVVSAAGPLKRPFTGSGPA